VSIYPPNTQDGGGYADGPLPKFNGPYGACFDLDGNLLVADCQNHKVRKVCKDTCEVTTIAGSTMGYLGNRIWCFSFMLLIALFFFSR
jgi:hypothetical protein